MTIRADHVQRPVPVQRQVATAEQRGIRFVGIIFQRIRRPIGQAVLRPRVQGDEALVHIAHVDRRAILVMNGRARQHQLHLVVVAGVDQQLPVGQLTRHDVRARRRDDHTSGARLSARPLHASRIAGKRDDGRRRRIIGCIKVALGIVQVKGAFVKRRRNLLERRILHVGSACRSSLFGCGRVFRIRRNRRAALHRKHAAQSQQGDRPARQARQPAHIAALRR